MREHDRQRARQALERARQDQREDRQLRFRGHRHEPGQHPPLHALVAHHVPRMHEHRHGLGRAMTQEVQDAGIVESLRTDVIADLHADVARRARLRHGAARGIDVLQRHLRQRLQPPRIRRTELDHAVVHAIAPGRGFRGVPRVAEHDRRRTHELDVDARVVHPAQARGRDPTAALPPAGSACRFA